MSHFVLFQFTMALFQGALMWLLPGMSSRRYFFAVTVGPEFRATAEGRAAVRRYRMWVLAATAAAVAGSQIALAPLLPIVAGIAAYLRERRIVRQYAARLPLVREADLTPGADRLPAWFLLVLPPFGMLAASAAWLRAHWASIPERFPTHWGIDGQPDRWTAKSAAAIYSPLLFGAGVIVLILFMSLATFYGSRQAPQRRALLKVFVAITYLLGFIFAAIGLMPVLKISPLVLLLPAPFFLIAALWWTMRAVESDPGEATPDECWHLGDFYYNPEDPALFVQKRMGWGYTFNFGNRLSWVILGGFLAGLAALILLLPR